MAEYIKREAAYEKCGWYNIVNGKSIYAVRKDELDAIPAADVVPVVQGRWLDTGYYGHSKSPIYMCSNCRKEVEDYFIKNHKFCLHCGARMDGGCNG